MCTRLETDYLSENASLLHNLKPAEKAKYNPTHVCLEGTRVELLERIRNWAADDDGGNVLWIKGAAGSGKSTLAATAAVALKGSVGGYFFCRRDDEELRDANKVLPTIASRLAEVFPGYGNLVVEALQKDKQLGSHAIVDQFEGLFKGPLGKLKELSRGKSLPSYLVVVDALDECMQEEGRQSLIKCFCGLHAIAPWLKFLVTSRPLQDISKAFGRAQNGSVLEFDMGEAQDITADVEKYLIDGLKKVAREHSLENWPRQDEKEALVKKASGLFIWASTICKFLQEAIDVNGRLRTVLGQDSQGNPHLGLYKLYDTVLSANFVDGQTDTKGFFTKVLAAVFFDIKVYTFAIICIGWVASNR